MANFLFNSRLQKRYENDSLVSISRAEYDFQNIPMGPGDKESLDNMVVQMYIQGIVSFDAIKQKIENDTNYFRDRSECIDVIYTFDSEKKEITSIVLNRIDIKAKFVFLVSDENEDIPESLLVENISSIPEMRNVYPERAYSDEKLEDEIDTYENRVETAQDYLEDEDDPTVRGVLSSRLYSYRQTLQQLLTEKKRRGL